MRADWALLDTFIYHITIVKTISGRLWFDVRGFLFEWQAVRETSSIIIVIIIEGWRSKDHCSMKWWKFYFLTTSFGKFLPNEVVKKENLSSFHVHRISWEISTSLFYIIYVVWFYLFSQHIIIDNKKVGKHIFLAIRLYMVCVATVHAWVGGNFC